jgi:hypothetical protein
MLSEREKDNKHKEAKESSAAPAGTEGVRRGGHAELEVRAGRSRAAQAGA